MNAGENLLFSASSAGLLDGFPTLPQDVSRLEFWQSNEVPPSVLHFFVLFCWCDPEVVPGVVFRFHESLVEPLRVPPVGHPEEASNSHTSLASAPRMFPRNFCGDESKMVARHFFGHNRSIEQVQRNT